MNIIGAAGDGTTTNKSALEELRKDLSAPERPFLVFVDFDHTTKNTRNALINKTALLHGKAAFNMSIVSDLRESDNDAVSKECRDMITANALNPKDRMKTAVALQVFTIKFEEFLRTQAATIDTKRKEDILGLADYCYHARMAHYAFDQRSRPLAEHVAEMDKAAAFYIGGLEAIKARARQGEEYNGKEVTAVRHWMPATTVAAHRMNAESLHLLADLHVTAGCDYSLDTRSCSTLYNEAFFGIVDGICQLKSCEDFCASFGKSVGELDKKRMSIFGAVHCTSSVKNSHYTPVNVEVDLTTVQVAPVKRLHAHVHPPKRKEAAKRGSGAIESIDCIDQSERTNEDTPKRVRITGSIPFIPQEAKVNKQILGLRQSTSKNKMYTADSSQPLFVDIKTPLNQSTGDTCSLAANLYNEELSRIANRDVKDQTAWLKGKKVADLEGLCIHRHWSFSRMNKSQLIGHMLTQLASPVPVSNKTLPPINTQPSHNNSVPHNPPCNTNDQ